MAKSYEAPSDGDGVLAGKLFLFSILSELLCFFLYVSLVFLVTSWTTTPVGYQVYERGDGEPVLVDTVYFSEQSEGEESTPLTETQFSVPLRSEVPQWASVTMNVVLQILMLLLWVCFAYSVLWKVGDRDKNSEDFHHGSDRPLRGLLVGVLAALPYAALYLLLVLSKLFGFLTVQMPQYYRLCHVEFFPILNRIMPAGATASEISWGAILLMLALWAILPLVCHLAYSLGHRRISVLYKTIYKNKPSKRA